MRRVDVIVYLLRRGVGEIGGRGWKELEARGGLGGEGMVNEHSDSTSAKNARGGGGGGGKYL